MDGYSPFVWWAASMAMLFVIFAIGLAAVPPRAQRIQGRVVENLETLRSAWGGTITFDSEGAPWSAPRYAFRRDGVPYVVTIRLSPRVAWSRPTFPVFEIGMSAGRERGDLLAIRRRGVWPWTDWLSRPSLTRAVATGDAAFDRRFLTSSELGAAAPTWLRDPEMRCLVAALLDGTSAELELRAERITLTRRIDSPERLTERRAIAPVVERFSALVERLTRP
ncbi:MAG: hypothetical protein JSU66_15515 [Deltaproteobacteria bacterium]|nr:MAG: hypothetical protein JSU66_15515 [Deltaproteobacteria bacterium]